jgi:CubicO group peptidase (beta-lactamase class C family)
MHFHHRYVLLALSSWWFGPSVVLADYLTPTYPAPIDLSSNQSLVSASWKNLGATFDQYIKTKTAGVQNVTFSVGMFSLHDPAAATDLQYHHTAPEIAHAKQGTNKVDGDSIYRVASVSKLITTFAGMVELTEADWNRPLSEIIPGLAKQLDNPIYTTQWDKITPWALATQLSGVATLGWPAGDLAVELAAAVAAGQASESQLLKSYGLPPVNVSALGPCATDYISGNTFCSAPDGIQGVAGLPPNFLPWTTPAYSDEGFMLLGIAISNLTGKPLTDVYRDSVFGPLGMNSSFDTHPTTDPLLGRSVVSGDPAANFALETGFTTPSGGILSTVNDLGGSAWPS